MKITGQKQNRINENIACKQKYRSDILPLPLPLPFIFSVEKSSGRVTYGFNGEIYRSEFSEDILGTSSRSYLRAAKRSKTCDATHLHIFAPGVRRSLKRKKNKTKRECEGVEKFKKKKQRKKEKKQFHTEQKCTKRAVSFFFLRERSIQLKVFMERAKRAHARSILLYKYI